MRVLEIQAKIEHLAQVFDFLDDALAGYDCPRKSRIQIRTAVEEVFANVASYAYGSESGPVTIQCDVAGDPPVLTITFADGGIPYDPLAKADPDLDIPAEERSIGGLGIYMVKKYMDDMTYEYKGGKNILTLRKMIGGSL